MNIHEAKTHFSQLIERVMRGEEVVIDKAGDRLPGSSPIRITRPVHPVGGRGGFVSQKISTSCLPG